MFDFENNEKLEFTGKNPHSNYKMKKFWTIVFLLLVLLIPIMFLDSIIKERAEYKQEAINSVGTSWANKQKIEVPMIHFDKSKNEKIFMETDDYSVDINIQTEIKKKGIFKVPVYVAEVKQKGNFITKNELLGKKLVFSYGVSDSKGFIEQPVININGNSIISHNTNEETVINKAKEKIPFEINYKVRGMNSISVVPFGKQSSIKISGNWESPIYEGDILPVNTKSENGNFYAEWSIPEISISNIEYPKVGVSLLIPVDNYRMSERTLKYAFLFLGLTFLSYFILEITSKESRKIHPLQYVLLGMAMLVFYLLLVSLSEFLSFGLSYLISALMIIFLINAYTYYVITKQKNVKFTMIIYALLVLLYAFLYILLSLQEFSLITGSIGMFIIIGAIMYATRNVDWYSD